jgi:hypothetical protein
MTLVERTKAASDLRPPRRANSGERTKGQILNPARSVLPRQFFLLAGCLALAGCAGGVPAGAPSPNPMAIEPTKSVPSPTPAPLPTPALTVAGPDTGWERLRPGLERRTINLFTEDGQPFEHFFILRLDPTVFRFDVAYHPQPQSLESWQSETGALIVINGGYYRLEEGGAVPNGLTIIGGEPMGTSYGDFGGMLTITQGRLQLRWLAQDPYDPDEPLQAALQSFPVLVKPGGVLGFPEQEEDNRAARRSVIAIDRDGRGLLITASIGNFTLHILSAYLVGSDLDLDVALNLDGGPSSGMLLADPFEEVSSLTPLPIVITVRQR